MIQKAHLKKWLFPILLLVATLILPNISVFGSDVVVPEDVVVYEDDTSTVGEYSVRVQSTNKDGQGLPGFKFTLYRVGDVDLTPLSLKLDPALETAIGVDSATLNDKILYNASKADEQEKAAKQKLAQIVARRLSRAVVDLGLQGQTEIMGSQDLVYTGLSQGLYLLAPSSDDGKYSSEATLFTLPYVGPEGSQNEYVIVPKVEEVSRDGKVHIHKVLTNNAKESDGFLTKKTYRFGLFSENLEETVKDLGLSALDIQASGYVTISAGSGEGDGWIENLPHGDYWIYELDEKTGLPILDYRGSTEVGNPGYNYILTINNLTGNSFTLDAETKEILVEAINRYHLGVLRLKKVLAPDFLGSSQLQFEVRVIRTVGEEQTEYESIMVPANGEEKEVMVDLEADRATGQEVVYSIREIVDPREETARKYIVVYSDDCKIVGDKTYIGETEAENPNEIELTVTNTLRIEISVEKDLFQFDTAEGLNPVGAQGKDLVYHIGLFDKEVTSESEPLAEDDITVIDGKADGRVVFSNLEAGKTYYVYELDANGKPVLGSEADEDGSKKESEEPEDDESTPVPLDGPENLNYYYTRYLTGSGEHRTTGNVVTTDATQSQYEVEVHNVYQGDFFRQAVLFLKKTLVDSAEADENKTFHVAILRQDLEEEGSDPKVVMNVEVPADGEEHGFVLSDETLQHRVRYTAVELDGEDGQQVPFGGYWSDGDTMYMVTAGANASGVEFDLTNRNNEGNPIEIINKAINLTVQKKAKYNAADAGADPDWLPLPLSNEQYHVGLYEGKLEDGKLVEQHVVTFKDSDESDIVTFTKAEHGKTYTIAEIELVDGKWVPVTEEKEYVGHEELLHGWTFYPVFSNEESSFTFTYDPSVSEIVFENRFDLPGAPFYSGHLTITKNLLGADGKRMNGANGLKFYAGIFLDKDFKIPAPTEGTNLRVNENPVVLDLSNRDSVSMIDIPITLYEGDRDANGVPTLDLYVVEVIDEKMVPVQNAASYRYTVTYGTDGKGDPKNPVTIQQNRSQTVVITNKDLTPTPSVTPPVITPIIITTPPNGTVTTNYSYNGSYAVTQDTVGTTTRVAVQTGDDTPIAMYVGILAVAGLLIAGLVVKRKKG